MKTYLFELTSSELSNLKPNASYLSVLDIAIPSYNHPTEIHSLGSMNLFNYIKAHEKAHITQGEAFTSNEVKTAASSAIDKLKKYCSLDKIEYLFVNVKVKTDFEFLKMEEIMSIINNNISSRCNLVWSVEFDDSVDNEAVVTLMIPSELNSSFYNPSSKFANSYNNTFQNNDDKAFQDIIDFFNG